MVAISSIMLHSGGWIWVFEIRWDCSFRKKTVGLICNDFSIFCIIFGNNKLNKHGAWGHFYPASSSSNVIWFFLKRASAGCNMDVGNSDPIMSVRIAKGPSMSAVKRIWATLHCILCTESGLLLDILFFLTGILPQFFLWHVEWPHTPCMGNMAAMLWNVTLAPLTKAASCCGVSSMMVGNKLEQKSHLKVRPQHSWIQTGGAAFIFNIRGLHWDCCI